MAKKMNAGLAAYLAKKGGKTPAKGAKTSAKMSMKCPTCGKAM